jgi:hypothetical protein
MRLLHTSTLRLKEFTGNNVPPHAILSHTWGDEEISYQDMVNEKATERKAYNKLFSTCEQAKRDGYDWVWIDTCCIDKSSSAELQESINSMFRWYSEASVCYCYLVDVPDTQSGWGRGFKDSRWWTRGWTLRKDLTLT